MTFPLFIPLTCCNYRQRIIDYQGYIDRVRKDRQNQTITTVLKVHTIVYTNEVNKLQKCSLFDMIGQDIYIEYSCLPTLELIQMNKWELLAFCIYYFGPLGM